MIRVHQNRNLQVVHKKKTASGNKNLQMVFVPITCDGGSSNHDKCSSKHKVQVCKPQQTASGN